MLEFSPLRAIYLPTGDDPSEGRAAREALVKTIGKQIHLQNNVSPFLLETGTLPAKIRVGYASPVDYLQVSETNTKTPTYKTTY